MDYSFLSGIDFMYTGLVIGLSVLVYWCMTSHGGWKLTLLFIIAIIVSPFIYGNMAERCLENNPTLYNYKIAIETGKRNDFSKSFYEGSSEEQTNLLANIAAMDVNKGKIGVTYGFGSSDGYRDYLGLYFGSIRSLNYTPITIPFGICVTIFLAVISLEKWNNNYLMHIRNQKVMQEELRNEKNKLEQDIIAKKQRLTILEDDIRGQQHILDTMHRRVDTAIHEANERAIGIVNQAKKRAKSYEVTSLSEEQQSLFTRNKQLKVEQAKLEEELERTKKEYALVQQKTAQLQEDCKIDDLF